MAKGFITSFDKDITMEIKEDEELLWRGAPQKASFILSKSVQLLPIALIWLCFDGFGISMIIRSNVPKSMLIFLIVFFAFHLMPVWLWIHSIISAIRKHKLVEYALTNQRVIIRNGGISKSYHYSELNGVHVKVGFIDRLFKVGDITLTGRSGVVLLDIDNPYAVGNKLQQFIEDFAQERKRKAAMLQKDCEYEEYHEGGKYGNHDNDEYYDDSEYNYRDSFRNDFEQVSFSSKGRYTSKKMPTEEDKSEEDEYLDNIMDSINKKDEF